jgi:hypothetical protein
MPTNLPTFDLQNSVQLLDKLERDLEKLRAARRREDIADAAFNFAITAWHMCDWVARDIRLAAEKLNGLPKTLSALKHRVKEECPVLEFLQGFVNASKHAETNKCSPNAAYISVGSGYLRLPVEFDEDEKLSIPKVTQEQIASMKHKVTIAIEKNNTWVTHDLITLCEEAEEYWHEFVHGPLRSCTIS